MLDYVYCRHSLYSSNFIFHEVSLHIHGYTLYRNLKTMVQENSTAQVSSGSRGKKVITVLWVTSYIVLAGTVGFLVYERVSRAEESSTSSLIVFSKT